MNQEKEYRSTEYWDPGQSGQGWPGIVSGGSGAKTEVLRPKGPRIFAMLVVVEGPAVGQVFRLNPSEAMTVGRDYGSDIVIDEPAVSRQHAKIRLEKRESDHQFFIQDLATDNGIEVNGKRQIKHFLNDGDRITLGRAVLVFKQV